MGRHTHLQDVTPADDPMLDADRTVTRVTREAKDKVRRRLGTSGSGKQFGEVGVLTLNVPLAEWSLAAGQYVRLAAESGCKYTAT